MKRERGQRAGAIGEPDAARDLARLRALIADIGVAMLTTRGRDGRWVSRPVATLAPFDGELWFFTSAASHKAAELEADPRVNVAYASPRDNAFASLSGHAVLQRDRRRIAALWSELQRVNFPGGPGDPDLVLIRVGVETAEYWDGPPSLVGRAVRFAAAALTGDADLLGDNRTLRIEHGSDGVQARSLHGNTRGDAGRIERARKTPAQSVRRRTSD